MKRRAIIIGVNDYDDKNITPLQYAISDANRLSGLLANLPGGDFSVKFLSNPLAEDITDELEKTVSELSAGDLFFFYFAGHGLQPHGSGQHLLLCRNARRAVLQGHGTNGSVPHTFLDDITKQCPADMIFCFDACRTSVQHDRNAAAQMTGSAALRDIGVGTSKSARGARLKILSCSDGESAEENVELGGGIFTFSLVSHMKSCVSANQSIIFDIDLMNSVAAQMQQHRTIGTQTPIFNSSMGKTLVLFNGTKQKAEEAYRAGDRKVLTIKGVEYTFRFCPAGSFMMGSPSGEKNRFDNETLHHVTLTKGFWMLETLVTQEMWTSVMGGNPNYFKGERHPVEQVSWEDCQAFLRKLNQRATPVQGMKFALPTEARWEYACRAGTTVAYGGTGVLDEMGWYWDNSGSKTHAVGQKQPNAWGLCDMHGNVWEWCQDRYGDYPSGSVTDPVGPPTDSLRVYRGGGWGDDARYCRSANRGRFGPSYRSHSLGVRIALVSDE